MLTSKHKAALVIFLVLQLMLLGMAVVAVLVPALARPVLAGLVVVLAVETVLYFLWRKKVNLGGAEPPEAK